MNRFDWLKPLRDQLANSDDSRGLIACFPEYRPDLTLAMARRLGFVHVDFRKSVMAPHGMEAAKLPLGMLTDALLDGMDRGDGVVLHNAEALLGCHPQDRRVAWFNRVLAPGWDKPFVIPVTLYGAELPHDNARVVRFLDADLPGENLLATLAGLR